jgi:hypothetical protein
MFLAPRFVAIDDNPAHLAAIVSALEAMGTSCLGVLFEPEKDVPQCLSGVRCLFVDLHLINGVPATDEKTHFANIASLIEGRVSDENGPYVLIVWTAHPQHRAGLEEFLNERLTDGRPIAVLGLEKESFLNVGTGAVTNAAGLRDEINKRITSVPQLAALLSWETDVLVAAGKTLGSLLTLVPATKRQSASYAGELDEILSRLACAAVGKDNVEGDPRAALVQALLPILADRICNRWSDDGLDIWKLAITKHGTNTTKKADAADAGRLNRMMHLAPLGNEKFGPSDWGSIVDYPYDFTAAGLLGTFGVDIDQLYGEFKIKLDDRSKCLPLLVRVGAVCDVAQRHAGPIPYLFGLQVPHDIKQDKPSAGIWKSPVLTDGENQTFRLQIHCRLLLSSLESECKSWKVRSRLREQILMELIAAQAEYISRPGIIRVD